jgi:restriction endonuclease Mrr
MAVSDFQTLMRPLLTYGQDGGEKNIREAIKALADAVLRSQTTVSDFAKPGFAQ